MSTNPYGDQVDPTGRIIVELRSDPEILAELGSAAKVYGGTSGDDAAAPYLIVRRLGPARRSPRAPFTRFRIAVSAFGATEAQASKLIGLVSDVLASRGPRRSPAGLAIYLSTEEVGAQSGALDPDTAEPSETAIYNVHAPHAS